MKFLRLLFYTLFFSVMFVFFLPKENLYQLAQHELEQRYKLLIVDKKRQESPFGIEAQSGFIEYDDIELARFDKLDMDFYFFVNYISLEGVRLSPFVESYLPKELQSLSIEYAIWNPFIVKIYAKGAFGVLEGSYRVKEHSVVVHLKASKLMIKRYKESLGYFKKTKTGEYIYEKSL